MPFVEPVLKKRRTTSTEGNIMPDSLIDSEEVQSSDSEGSTSSDSEWGWLDTDSGDTSDEDDDPDAFLHSAPSLTLFNFTKSLITFYKSQNSANICLLGRYRVPQSSLLEFFIFARIIAQ